MIRYAAKDSSTMVADILFTLITRLGKTETVMEAISRNEND